MADSDLRIVTISVPEQEMVVDIDGRSVDCVIGVFRSSQGSVGLPMIWDNNTKAFMLASKYGVVGRVRRKHSAPQQQQPPQQQQSYQPGYNPREAPSQDFVDAASYPSRSEPMNSQPTNPRKPLLDERPSREDTDRLYVETQRTMSAIEEDMARYSPEQQSSDSDSVSFSGQRRSRSKSNIDFEF